MQRSAHAVGIIDNVSRQMPALMYVDNIESSSSLHDLNFLKARRRGCLVYVMINWNEPMRCFVEREIFFCSPIRVSCLNLCRHPDEGRPRAWADKGYSQWKLWRGTILLWQNGAVWLMGQSSSPKWDFSNGWCDIVIELSTFIFLAFIFPKIASPLLPGVCFRLTPHLHWLRGKRAMSAWQMSLTWWVFAFHRLHWTGRDRSEPHH